MKPLIPFGEIWTPYLSPDVGYILPLLLFYENGFGIKQPTNVDMP